MNRNKHITKSNGDTKLRKSTNEDNEITFLRQKCGDILDGLKDEVKLTETVQKLSYLNIDNKEKLTILVSQIFQKGINDSKNSEVYAKLCHRLSTTNKICVGSKDSSFREFMVNHCQLKFKDCFCNRDLNSTELWQEKINALGFWSSRASPNQCETKSNKNEVIAFLAQLFIYEILTAKIMNNVIEKLLSVMDSEEVWDCLCSLLFLIGQAMESKNYDLTLFLIKMREIVKNKNFPLSEHSKEYFKQLNKLRRNKWKKMDATRSEPNLCAKFEAVRFSACVEYDGDNDWALGTLNKVVLPRRVIRNQLRQAQDRFNQV